MGHIVCLVEDGVHRPQYLLYQTTSLLPSSSVLFADQPSARRAAVLADEAQDSRWPAEGRDVRVVQVTVNYGGVHEYFALASADRLLTWNDPFDGSPTRLVELHGELHVAVEVQSMDGDYLAPLCADVRSYDPSGKGIHLEHRLGQPIALCERCRAILFERVRTA